MTYAELGEILGYERSISNGEALEGLASFGSFLRAVGDEWRYPDDLPPMFWETRTFTNCSRGTVDIWGPRLGAVTLRPGESMTVPLLCSEHATVVKTTAQGWLR